MTGRRRREHRTTASTLRVHQNAVRAEPGTRHAAPPPRPRRSRRPDHLVRGPTRPRRDHRRGRRRQDRRDPRRDRRTGPLPARDHLPAEPRPSGSAACCTTSSTALGQVPSFYTATLAPQAADALAAEHAERGRTPVIVIDEAHLLDNQQLEAITDAHQPRHGLRGTVRRAAGRSAHPAATPPTRGAGRPGPTDRASATP